MTREMRMEIATENNALGLQEYDLVQTTGKGIGIVLRKKSLNDELVIYSMSSASETHPNDDDGMAKVCRYYEDGTIAQRSEKTGRKLKNRDIYTITGIKSYTNPVLAMKDFINQNEDIEFDPVVEPEPEVVEEPEVETTETTDGVGADTETDTATETSETVTPSQDVIFTQMLEMLNKINEKLDNI